MSDVVLVAIITGASVAIPTILTSILNRRVLAGKLDTVKTEINGRMTELLKAEKSLSKTEGKEEQKQETKERKL